MAQNHDTPSGLKFIKTWFYNNFIPLGLLVEDKSSRTDIQIIFCGTGFGLINENPEGMVGF